MVFKPDQHKMQQLLSEAITVLCKNGLNYQSHVNVEALIGITLDDDEVFLVSVRETIQSMKPQQMSIASPTYSSSPAHRPRATPNRKRPAPNTFHPQHSEQAVASPDHGAIQSISDSNEPPAKRPADDADVIQIKGEHSDDEDTSDTVVDQAGADFEENQQSAEPPDDDGGGDAEGDSYDTSQLEQFVDFATTSQSSELGQVDSKAAVFANHPAMNQPIPDPAYSMASSSLTSPSHHQQMKSSPSRTPQQFGYSSPRSFGTQGFDRERSPAKPKQAAALDRPFGSPIKKGRSTIEILPDAYTGDMDVAVHQTWECAVCGASFNSKTTCLNHRKKHLGQFRYNCDICDKGFMGLGDMKGHMASHTKKKDFCCPVCSKLFTYKQSFRVHLKAIHHITDNAELAQITASAKLVSDLKTKYAP